MIRTIFTPMPMPIAMPIGECSKGIKDPYMIISIFAAFFILGMVLYIGGWLYEGIKNKDWGLYPEDNTAKLIGVITMAISAAIAFILAVAFKIYSALS